MCVFRGISNTLTPRVGVMTVEIRPPAVYGFMSEGQCDGLVTVMMSRTGFGPVHLAAG